MVKGNGQSKVKPKMATEFELPKGLTVQYADRIQIAAKQFGVVFDVAQQVGPTNRYMIVSRIGMSREHARALCEKLLAMLQQVRIKETKKAVIN